AIAKLGTAPFASQAFANLDAFASLGTEAAARAARLYGLPPNLRLLGEDLDIDRVDAVGRTFGVALYLVPRASVCRLILSAPDGSVLDVLIDHEPEILADCDALLDRCTRSPELGAFVGLVREAIHAHRDGHVRAAQSLAATTLDSLLSTVYGAHFVRKQLGHGRGDEPGAELAASPLAYRLVHLPLWCAHERFFPAKGDEPRTEFFSRHATVHATESGQLTRENSLLALMMLASLLGWQNRL
ncbi:hypothetical protein, partial [Isoptericola sp. NPDC055881]